MLNNMGEQIDISPCETIVDIDKFNEVYFARFESVEIIAEGVIERYEQYKKAINDNNTTINS